MPGLQVVDLSPLPRTETTPLEKTLAGFAGRHRSNQIEKQETDALSDIYSKYQNEGRQLDEAIMAVQTRPGLSPTTRVNSVNQLLKLHETNQKLQNQTLKQDQFNKKVKEKEQKDLIEQEKKEAEKKQADAALDRLNASQEQKDLYQVAPVGGKTKIIEDIIDTSNRNKTPPGLTNPDVEDYDAGLTPKERVKRQDDRYKIQTPLVRENSNSLAALQTEELSINLLNELTDSGKVGEGLQKLNINPKTGDLFLPQAATPEEQLFVKTVNDFTVKAKDSFGARVTNFELDRFMQRLPTLANSAEGRRLILRQMKTINEINQLEKKALQDVFDQYGVRNIDYADAENKARSKISSQKEELRKEYVSLEHLARKEESEFISQVKEKAPEGYIPMRKPDGSIKYFPKKNQTNLLEKGYKSI